MQESATFKLDWVSLVGQRLTHRQSSEIDFVGDRNCDDEDKAVLINSIGLNNVIDPVANKVGLTFPPNESEQINDCGEHKVSDMGAVELEVQHSVNCDENRSIIYMEELDPTVQNYQVNPDSPLPHLADISVNDVEELDPQVQTQGESDGQLPDC